MFDFAVTTEKLRRPRIVKRLSEFLLRRHAAHGTLSIRFPDGTETVIREGEGRLVRLELTSWRWGRRIMQDPALMFGEAYVDGGLLIHDGTIYDLLDMLLATYRQAPPTILVLRAALSRASKRWRQYNPIRTARFNVARHYDLSADFYKLLLDEDRQYSCAYFPTGNETLAEAQIAKKRHIASKLVLDRPGLRVLDIGCGWGGMALTLARDYGADVTGVTLSQEQLEVARARAVAAGLADRVRFELQDYRAVPQRYDRIVSVGMFEHVGVNHYRRFFDLVQRCLEPDGVALIHAIGRSHGPAATNPWLNKYIFPGGYSPALSEVLPSVERSGLVATDIEILRLHYAKTLGCWRANLERNRDAVMQLYDARFLRMFEFYLAAAELAFVRTGHMVWQMQLARQQSAVPLTRDYITE